MQMFFKARKKNVIMRYAICSQIYMYMYTRTQNAIVKYTICVPNTKTQRVYYAWGTGYGDRVYMHIFSSFSTPILWNGMEWNTIYMYSLGMRPAIFYKNWNGTWSV